MRAIKCFFLLFLALSSISVVVSQAEAGLAEKTEAAEEDQQYMTTGGNLSGEDEVIDLDTESDTETGSRSGTAKQADDSHTSNETAVPPKEASTKKQPIQAGPFIDLLGPTLLSLHMIDETHAQLQTHLTNDILSGKSVVGLYFSADWCGPCRQFTPELVQFYNKMNSRRGKEGKFEIVWVSRCRDMESFGQYFTHMNWLALPPEEALGPRGQMLSAKYRVKSIPTLVLLDEVGSVITLDARNKLPQDKAGIGFPWRNPLSTLYMTLFPKSLRLMLKSQLVGLKDKLVSKVKSMVPIPSGK